MSLHTLHDCHIVATDNNAAIGLLLIPCAASRQKGVDFLPVSVVFGMCWCPFSLISPVIESIFTMPGGNCIKIKHALFQSVEYEILELRVRAPCWAPLLRNPFTPYPKGTVICNEARTLIFDLDKTSICLTPLFSLLVQLLSVVPMCNNYVH